MSEMVPEKSEGPPAVVVLRTSVLDGTIVSWFLNLEAARFGREVVSASRTGVMIHGDIYWHDIPPAWLEAAQEAHAALCLDAGADLVDLATHRRSSCRQHELEPVVPALVSHDAGEDQAAAR